MRLTYHLHALLGWFVTNSLALAPRVSIHNPSRSEWKKPVIRNPRNAQEVLSDDDWRIFLDEGKDTDTSRRLFLASVVSGALSLNNAEPCAAQEAFVASPRLNTVPRDADRGPSVSDSSSQRPPESASSIVDSKDASTEDEQPPAVVDWKDIVTKAGKKALGGGRAGASAAVVQVGALMWLRTSMNYQYRYGGSLQSSLKTLWEEGGIQRLYQGLPFALIQGPLTRFGDTAANVGIVALFETLPASKDLPLPLITACGSTLAGLWRLVLMPIDSSKTASQVDGAEGLKRLWGSVADQGPAPLYRGALAQAAATAAGHYPWFLTYNFLDGQIPMVSAADDLILSLGRSALLGLCASCVSDCVSNSLRVIKTTKQTAQLSLPDGSTGEGTNDLSYPEVVSMIIEKDGIQGLLGRGLKTRLLTNAIQGALFSVLWKYFQQTGGVL